MSEQVLCIKSWDIYSPFGNKEESENALKLGKSIFDTAENTECYQSVPDFNHREILGKKGTRNFDRQTGLLVAASRNVVSELNYSAEDLKEIGIVNGTSTGSLSSILDFLLDTFRHDKPYFINPAHMPNTVMNCAAGQSAIWHKTKGPNATLAAGSQCLYAAFRKSARWLRKGYAKTILVSAVEDITPDTGLLYKHYYEKNKLSTNLSEGCGVFSAELLPVAEASGHTQILGSQLGVCFGDENKKSEQLNKLITKLLVDNNVSPEEIQVACSKSSKDSSSLLVEKSTLKTVSPEALHINSYDVFGHGYSVSGAFQLVLTLSKLEENQYGLLVNVSKNGSMACALVKKGAL